MRILTTIPAVESSMTKTKSPLLARGTGNNRFRRSSAYAGFQLPNDIVNFLIAEEEYRVYLSNHPALACDGHNFPVAIRLYKSLGWRTAKAVFISKTLVPRNTVI